MQSFSTPQLRKIHSGKVRESYAVSSEIRLMVTTDRISCFDQVLQSVIPGKGAALNTISNWWFNQTKDIIPNHLQTILSPSANLVQEIEPIRLEVIVRNYLTGSAWNAYKQGKRTLSGALLPEGLNQNSKLPAPIVTPTTKGKVDTEITPEEIVKQKITDKTTYNQLENYALKLFNFGSAELAKKRIILVDTKYEFGLHQGNIILMDELHTPDSSRFWFAKDYQQNPLTCPSIDKERVRQWLKANSMQLILPEEVIHETKNNYNYLCELITGKTPIESELLPALIANKILRPGYIIIVMGSKNDYIFAEKIASRLKNYDLFIDFRIISAHKNGERLLELAEEYNNSLEPGVVIAIAGLSNGLGGALAANLNVPVINCPPAQSHQELQMHLNSSLFLPSGAPALTVIGPEQAADAALRTLNIPAIRQIINANINELKQKLSADDFAIRRIK